MATNKDQALLIEVDPSRANHILYLPGILKLSLERGWNFVWNSLELSYLESTSGYLEHTFLHKGDHYPSSSFSFLNKLACHWVFQEAGVEYNKLIIEKHEEKSRAEQPWQAEPSDWCRHDTVCQPSGEQWSKGCPLEEARDSRHG